MGLVLSFFAFVVRRFHGDESNTNRKFDIKDGITLFDAALSPCARRVRMTLIEKGFKYSKVEVNLLEGEQSDPKFQEISPNRKVPALAVRNVQGISDCTLFESNVISEYLDDVLPGESTYPADPWDRAQAKRWQDWELAWADEFWPVFYVNVLGFLDRMLFSREKYLASLSPNLSVFQRNRNIRTFDGEFRTEAEMEGHILTCYKNLLTLEEALEGNTYLVGGKFSTADLSVVPRVMMFGPGGMPVTPTDFPNICRYMDCLKMRKCFIESQPLTARLSMFLLEVASPLIVFLGNMRSGKTYSRVHGGRFVARAKAEAAEGSIPCVPELSSLLMEDEVCVYDYPTAAECWQVKLLLNEKELAYKTVSCDPLEIIGRPMGVGGLYRIHHGRRIVTGSRALMSYLDSLKADKQLFPDDPLQKAQVQCWQAWEQNMASYEMSEELDMTVMSKVLHSRFPYDKVDDLLRLRSDPRYSDKFGRMMTAFMTSVIPGSTLWEKLKSDYGHLAESAECRNQKADNCCSSIHERLAHLDKSLKGCVFLVGTSVTAADICVFCRLLYIPYLGMEISEQKYPNVRRWMAGLKERKHFLNMAEEVDRTFSTYIN